MKSIAFCRERKASSALRTAAHARVKQLAYLRAGTSSPVNFTTSGKRSSTRWAGGVDLSMMPDAGALDSADETCREYERVVDPKYLDQIRAGAKQFSNKRLSRESGVARSAIMNFKKGRNTIKPLTLRKLTRAIHVLQNKYVRD